MGEIQNSINSILGSVSHAAMAYKGFQKLSEKNNSMQSPQAQASAAAEESSANEIEAKKIQRQKLQQAWESGQFSNLSPARQSHIKAYLDSHKEDTD